MLQQNGDYGHFRTDMQTVFNHGLLLEYRVRICGEEDELIFQDSRYDFNSVVRFPSKPRVIFPQSRSYLQLWFKRQSNEEVFWTNRSKFAGYSGQWYLFPFCFMKDNERNGLLSFL